MSKPLWKKGRILLIGAAIALAVFLAAFFYVFSSPVDLSSQHARIEAIIEKRTGIKVKAEAVVLKAFPHIDLRIKDAEAFDGNAAFLKIRSMRLVLPLLSIFSRSININSLDIDGLELNVTRNASGEINLARLLKKPTPVTLKRLNLSDARASFKDEAANAAFDVTGIKAAITRTREGFDYAAEAALRPGVKISLRGTGDDGKGRLAFSGTCAVKGFDLARLTPYIRKSLPNASISGMAGFAGSYSYDGDMRAKGSLTYKNAAAVLPGLLAKPLVSASGSAAMSFFRDKKGTVSAVDRAALAFDGFSLSGSLKVKTLAATNGKGVEPLQKVPPVFEAQLSSTPAPVRTLMAYIPAPYSKMLEKVRPVDGTVALKNLSVSGTSGDLKERDTYKRPGFASASVKFDNVKVKHQNLEKPFAGIRGVLAFKDNVLSLEHFTGRHGAISVDDLSGEIKDPAGKADYRLSLAADLETSQLLPLARALLEDRLAQEDIEKLGKARLAGKAGLILKLKGKGRPLRGFDGLKGAAYSGALRLNGVDAGYGDIPLALKSLKGLFAFDNSGITLKGVEGTDEFKSLLGVDGSVTHYLSKSPALDIRARGALSQGTADTAFRKWGIEGPVYGGSVPFTISLRGSPGSLSAKASLNFTPIAIEYKNIVKKSAGVKAFAKGSFSLSNKELSIKEFILAFGKTTVNGGGRLSLGDGHAYNFFALSRHVDIDDLGHVAAFLVDGAASGGILAFDVKTEKNAQDKKPSYEGDVTFKDGRFNAVFLAKPVEKVSASLKFGKDAVHFALDKLSAGQTEVSARLDAQNGTISFEVDSPGFFLEDFIKKAEGPPSDTAPGAPLVKKQNRIKNFLFDIIEAEDAAGAAPAFIGGGIIKIKKGSIMGRTFEDLSAGFVLEKDALYIKPITYFKNEGSAAAQVTVYRGASTPLLFAAKMDFSGVQLEPFFKEMGAKKQILSGPVRGTMELTGRRGASPFTAGLNGSVYLRSEDGRLYKFTLLSKIFSIVNILSITELFEEGLPYKYISGDFTVKDGIISTNNLRLDASSMRMSALGEISLPDAAIDAVLAMHPFVTIDKIISTIPLAGWIIGGRQESTLSMYYDIVGPLKEPEVGPAPIKGLGAGVLGILQRLIEAPVELLRPDSAPK
ncbi:MAG: AsmA-like C-terminal domain-containing protein [Deltaproteobacteria bacterium]|nr:AsmA-like C-terminal domain-containing protein [Deltaproteobacteria bacterium]